MHTKRKKKLRNAHKNIITERAFYGVYKKKLPNCALIIYVIRLIRGKKKLKKNTPA